MIKQAAIRLNGTIYTGYSHGNIRLYDETFREEARKFIHTESAGEEGYVDEKGIFYDRREAAKIAYECGQIKEETNRLESWQIR